MASAARVLVVDDDQSIREFVELALADAGYEVTGVPHGKAALDSISVSCPDLIVLDLRTPVMDGWEFARVYKQTTSEPAPIIIITATNNPEVSAAEIGAVAILPKPFDLRDLLRLVRRYVRDGASRRV